MSKKKVKPDENLPKHDLYIAAQITDLSGRFPSLYESFAEGKFNDLTTFRVGLAIGGLAFYLFIDGNKKKGTRSRLFEMATMPLEDARWVALRLPRR